MFLLECVCLLLSVVLAGLPACVGSDGWRAWLVSGLCGSIQPNYFYMFVFWLKCPLKAMKKSAFIRRSSRLIPFQKSKEWSSLLCSGSFHLSEVIFTEQTGRLIINLHLRGQNLNSPTHPPPSVSPWTPPPTALHPSITTSNQAVPLLAGCPGLRSGLLAQNIFSSDWACPYCLHWSGSSQGRSV